MLGLEAATGRRVSRVTYVFLAPGIERELGVPRELALAAELRLADPRAHPFEAD